MDEARREGLARTVGVNWEAVYAATYEDLVRYLFRRLWDSERAQDLAQEAFVRALRHEPDDPRAWLFAVARNLARDEARSASRRKRHLTLLRTEADAAPARFGVGAAVEKEETLRSVRTALDTLSERDRETLLLWSAGLSYAEIAAHTGLAKGAIGTTLARARRRLADAYNSLEDRDAARR